MFLPFCGLPLVEWSFIAAKACRKIQRIICVTESPEIADIARRYGADIIWQTQAEIDDAEARGKLGGMVAINRVAIELATKPWQGMVEIEQDIMVALLPTSPLRKPEDIDNMLMLSYINPTRWVTSVTEYEGLTLWADWPGHGNAIQPIIFLGPDETRESHEKDKRRSYARIFRENPGIGVGLATIYKQNVEACLKVMAGDRDYDMRPHFPIGYVMDRWQEYDIDTKDEFELCEYWFERKVLRGRGRSVFDSVEILDTGF